jgi:hypothetical protein
MDLIEVSKVIAQVGGLVVLAGAILIGLVIPKTNVEAILKERDKADAIRDARLEDQKNINRDLTEVLKDNADALKRLADAWEARNRAEADSKARPNV